MDKNKLSFQMNVEDFLPADESEKQSLVVMRERRILEGRHAPPEKE